MGTTTRTWATTRTTWATSLTTSSRTRPTLPRKIRSLLTRPIISTTENNSSTISSISTKDSTSTTISLTFSTRTNLSLHKCRIPSRSLSTKVSVHEGNCLADKYVTVLDTKHIYDKNK